MPEPDFLVCMECESPVYVFEWAEGRLVEALCTVCGNDDIAAFATEEELEAMALEHSDASDGR